MKRIVLLLIVVLSFAGLSLRADEVDFKVSAPAQVSMGERFRVTYQINAEIDEFTPPSFNGFNILSGPSKGQNSSIQIVNGKVTQSISISYTYILAASKEGELELAPATARVGNKTYQTKSKKIQVSAPTAPAQNQQNNNKADSDSQGQLKADDVYIKAFVNKRNVTLGEQLIVTYRIYTKVPVSNLSIDKQSAFGGFWSVDLLENDGNLKQSTEVINGEEYIVADLKKAALFPQKTGDLEIEPMTLNCLVQVQTGKKRTTTNDPFFDSFFNDPFFSNSFRNVEKSLVSNGIKVSVKDLQSQQKPASFTGAVGQFSLGSNIDHKAVAANEAITIKYTISGNGNIDLLPDLNAKFPADFEVYDPKISIKTRKEKEGISGYKTYEYTVIPRSAGTYEIPSVTFSYFDPAKNAYLELNSDAYEVTVTKSSQSASQNVTYSSDSKQDIRYLGNDIQYIFLMPFEVEPFEHFFFGSWSFYLLLLSPLALMIFVYLFWQKEKQKRGNTHLMRNKNATKMAKKRLLKAHEFLKSRQETAFYNEMAQALWGYVSDKFSIPLSELSNTTVTEKLSAKGVSESIIQEFISTLNNCEFARFAPGDKESMMENVYQQGFSIMSKIEDELK
jgi:hypothetical protein